VIALPSITRIRRRSFLIRLAVALAAGFVVGFALFFWFSSPKSTLATPRSVPVPITSAAVRTDLRVGLAPNAGVSIAFSSPMNPRSVAAALRVTPAATVDLGWDVDGTLLTVRPRHAWTPDTLHTITIEPGALAANGQPMPAAVRAAFLIRAATVATIAATSRGGSSVFVDTAFELSFDHPIDATTLRSAVTVEPATAGGVEIVGRRSGVRYRFVPAAPLAPNTAYSIEVAGVVDAAGGSVAPASLQVRTAAAPRVVRFRPVDGAGGIATDALLSVRFTVAMDRMATTRAFSVTANGKAVAGTVSFAEGDTVLVFRPTKELPSGGKVVMTISTAARATTRVALARPGSATFATAAAPPATVRTPSPAATPPPTSGSAGSGPWAAVEAYYLKLMNCTRTGGWVTSTGACSSPGGRAVAPLRLDAGISAKVSRPYAKLLATRNACNHFLDGNPGNRLSRAGYTSYIWAENIGCRSGDPYAAVLGSHLFFQAEKPSLGGHYVNLMNAKYDRVGIGVWVYGGRVRLVVDFYHPR